MHSCKMKMVLRPVISISSSRISLVHPCSDAAPHIVYFHVIESFHYVQGASAAGSGMAIDQVSFVLIEFIHIIAERFRKTVYVESILYMSTGKLSRCSHIQDHKIRVVLIALYEVISFHHIIYIMHAR